MTDYLRSRRRLLLDMHIPDWDERFLAEYDPAELARLYRLAGADGALVYCTSHLGLSYWPSPVGGVHRAARDRDLVAEAKSALEAEGIAVAAYHSVIYNSWAANAHPEWRIVPVGRETGSEWTVLGNRYGTLCPNRREYVEFEKRAITALLERYDFPALWIDMAFWTAVCVCEACSARLRAEHGIGIPRVIDWADAEWVAFQSARERWIAGFAQELAETARAVRPGIAVTHNLAPGLRDWSRGQRAQDARLDDFVAGDLYGGFDEQVFVLALMRGLRTGVLAEFMTTRTRDLFSHSSTKSEHEMLVQGLAAVASDAAFLFIDAIDPTGRLNERVYQRIGRVFSVMRGFEPELGGSELTDVAIYYSDDSRIDENDTGRHAASPLDAGSRHQDAVMGAARALRRGHIPFSVVTRLDNDRLARFPVIVLPDARRLSAEDIAAMREYVGFGGRLYASGRTGLLLSDGTALTDFALADVFGCHATGREEGTMLYARPETAELREAAHPEPYLPIGGRRPSPAGAGPVLGLPRVRADEGTRVLARLTLPYGYPADGSAAGRDFASLHSSPPWLDTEHPSIVAHDFGEGRVVYSSAPLETGGSPQHEGALRSLLLTELGLEPRLSARGHPDVWIAGFDQPERERMVVTALRLVEEPPESTVTMVVRARVPEGRRVTALRDLASGGELEWRSHEGAIEFDLPVEVFAFAIIDLAIESTPRER